MLPLAWPIKPIRQSLVIEVRFVLRRHRPEMKSAPAEKRKAKNQASQKSAKSAGRTAPGKLILPLSWTPWRGACVGLLVVTAGLRLFDLSAKPLHHDEGVNGMFMTTLFRSGYYHYDPSNYHGPT